MEFHRGRMAPKARPAASVAAGRALAELVDLGDEAASPERFVVVESCHSTWLFDTVDRRFCRVLRNSAQPSAVASDWRPYDRLVVEDRTGAFVVFLDQLGTRLLRSWRHAADCVHCDRDVTSEMSLGELRRVTRA
ncbi:MAG: hypothetical protein ABSC73_03740 [Acidimicrobiales bacterium]